MLKANEYLEKYYESRPYFGKGGGMDAERVKVFLGPFYDLTGVATGLLYSRARIYKAFIKGRSNTNFYSIPIEVLMNSEMEDLVEKSRTRSDNKTVKNDKIAFMLYALAAIILSFTFFPAYLVNRIQLAKHKNSSPLV